VSIGIGRAIVKGLAAEGVQVAAVARRTRLLEELADEIEQRQGPRPLLITQDIMASDAATRLRDAAFAGLGQVGILVTCAGGSRPLPSMRRRKNGRRRPPSISPFRKC